MFYISVVYIPGYKTSNVYLFVWNIYSFSVLCIASFDTGKNS